MNSNPMNLKIARRELENGIAVIELGGRVAIGRDSGHIEPEVLEAIRCGAKKVILDLAAVSHIDSTGIGIMAYCFGKAAQAGTALCISGARANVLNVFQVTRLIKVVPFFPDVESAVQGNGRML